ncbi:hypothetical protein JOC34_001708 [Virgibacillus halotolerans]|uniref:hypothetical protein n=1 Tax=Virgibacillus halotolerans TaxID=1071053 RepID=UPI001960B821|nr:hypothetical protein [Virgibacillus halotolerans]MBM7599340.1 hypothetical protein [Virgibacillus halotolerans]
MAQKDKLTAAKQESYVEVIGDTVLGKHLITTIIISVFLSLGFFHLGKFIFPKVAPENMVQSYSLLLGIAGSLIALLVNALLFKPKRKLLESSGTTEELSIIYKDLQLDLEDERESITNDPVTMEEMKEQGIYDMFFSDEEDRKE